MDTHFNSRAVAVCGWLAAVLPLVALVVFLAAYRFDVGRLTDLPSIVDDPGAARRFTGRASPT